MSSNDDKKYEEDKQTVEEMGIFLTISSVALMFVGFMVDREYKEKKKKKNKKNEE